MEVSAVSILGGLLTILAAFVAYWAKATDQRLAKLESGQLPVAEKLVKLETLMGVLLSRLDEVMNRLEKKSNG